MHCLKAHGLGRGGWRLAFLLACTTTLRAQTNDSPRPWPDYRTILWIGDTVWKQPDKLPLFFQRLREMGINTAMVFGDASPQPFLDRHFPYYVENLVNRGLCLKFNSKVVDWDKFVTGWSATGRPESALVRDYCLDDPQWRQWARHEVETIALKNRDHEPLAYNLRDELSTTISANPFDYDFNPLALAGFRDWLKTQYAGLDALNAEWETRFDSWDEVRPFTTDEIKHRMGSGEVAPRGRPDWQQVQALRFDPLAARQSPTRWNLAPWADFRSYMDLSLARALADFRQAPARWTRARRWASKAPRYPTPLAATTSGGSPACSIGSSRTTSAAPAKSSAPSCPESPCSPPFSNRTPRTLAGASGISCSKATAVAWSGGARIAWTGAAPIIGSRPRAWSWRQ